MVLKANDRRTSCPCHDEFRGPRSDYVRQNCYGQGYDNGANMVGINVVFKLGEDPLGSHFENENNFESKKNQ
ncbi:hypothetical protein TNCV_5133681 [Trichonephila clavipes]|nr:hypothetical protein TNCV_5133681 [Trichonephila clavipes]